MTIIGIIIIKLILLAWAYLHGWRLAAEGGKVQTGLVLGAAVGIATTTEHGMYAVSLEVCVLRWFVIVGVRDIWGKRTAERPFMVPSKRPRRST